MTLQEMFKYAMKSNGWTDDAWGSLRFTNKNSELFRLKFQKISVRFEIRRKIGNKNEWLKIWSGYFKNLTVDVLDKIDSRINR